MKNPAREACYNPSCNNEAMLWTSHLPCTDKDFQSSNSLKNLLPSPHACLSNHTFLYTPQIKSYFKQPPYNKPLIIARTMSPTFTFKELIEWGIGNELNV